MKNKLGFTLIELLVVIAIISILAAILFPVFASAREKARQISCLSNEKQIGLGMIQYVQDYDEYFPQGQYQNGAGVYIDWQQTIYPYIKSGQSTNVSGGQEIYNGLGGVFSCPSYPQVELSEYGVHPYLCPTASSGYPVVNLAKIDDTTDKVILVEKGQGAQGNFPVFDADESSWVGYLNDGSGPSDFVLRNAVGDPAPSKDLAFDYDEVLGGTAAGFSTSPSAYPRYRHTALTNVLFIDGHAKAMHKGQMSGEYWLKYIWLPNVYPAGSTDVPNSYVPNF